jgi:VIT1/CCC1 family predicted Fe2+/Mn2+ transporter
LLGAAEKKAGVEMARNMTDKIDDNPTSRSGWLRAAVLGADDGIVSTAALMVGVAASNASMQAVLTAGLAGLVAGAASMAAGEYVSVSSQRDLERSLREREESLTKAYPNVALTESAIALQLRGIDPGLARKVANDISIAEPIEANVRVKYGMSESTAARPLQAALASAISFAIGAIIPLLGMFARTPAARIQLTVAFALFALAAGAGGAPRLRGSLRVVLGGGLAMAISAIIGRIVGIVV